MQTKAKQTRATLITPPASEPVTLAQAKNACNLAASDTAHDDKLTLLIQAAREQWEHDTDAACLTQVWELSFSEFQGEEIRLPKRTLQSVGSVKYYDTLNSQQTLSTSVYDVDLASRLGYLQQWPAIVDRWDAVTIRYTVGYASAAAVPAIHKQAILMLVAYYFENPDMLVSDQAYTMAPYERLVARYMRSDYP